MAQRAEKSKDERFLKKCLWFRCLDRSAHYAWRAACRAKSAHSDFGGSRVYACLCVCNLSPALFAEWPDFFTCHSGYTGVKRSPSKYWRRKLTLEKKKRNISRRSCRGSNPGATFRPWVRPSASQAIPTPSKDSYYVSAKQRWEIFDVKSPAVRVSGMVSYSSGRTVE